MDECALITSGPYAGETAMCRAHVAEMYGWLKHKVDNELRKRGRDAGDSVDQALATRLDCKLTWRLRSLIPMGVVFALEDPTATRD